MMSPQDRLVYMANQIARNLAAAGPDAAALALADHIAAFWDQRMKARLFAMADPRLDPIAARGVALLRTRGESPPQPAATILASVREPGGSDAG